MQRLNVSIVLHNTPSGQLEGVLSSLSSVSLNKIFIIENSNSPNYRNITETNPKIIYRHIENHGYGHAHNIAFRESIKDGADFHLVLNPDVMWETGVLEQLMDFMVKNVRVGVVQPKICNPDGSLQYSCRLIPSPADLFAKRFIPSGFFNSRTDRFLLRSYSHEGIINVPYLTGCFLLFRVTALKECGLFDERFFLYPEDLDLVRRMHETWHTVYYPVVSVIHEHQRDSAKKLRMLFIHFSNMVLYFNKWGWIKDKKRKKFNDALLNHLNLEKKRKTPGPK
ncbi:MAG: glycosyltransferase family 2 protein [Muribaculaceae bacterium]|nr:glycosyltransferase family 2 protein [Muribaculaceae bacterium]